MSEPRPKVSVLVAVYNGERFVEATVRSILAQSFRDLEMVILDDGSRDGSLAILNHLAATDARIRLASRPNRGIPATANEMIALARGEHLSLMDHDDIMLPGCLEAEVAHLERHPECVAVGVLDAHIDAAGRIVQRDRSLAWLAGSFSRRPSRPMAFPPVSPTIKNPASLVRAGAMRRAGGYREKFTYANDTDLWLRLGEQGEIHRLNRVLCHYRRHGGNATMTRRAEIMGYDVIAHLSAIARHEGLDDRSLIDDLAGSTNYSVIVDGYRRLIGERYPIEPYLLYRAVGHRLPQLAGLGSLPEVQHRAAQLGMTAPPTLPKLKLLRRSLSRQLSG